MDYLIKIKDLRKSFDKAPVLNGLNMNVAKGDVYGLIGPNGAGKTTTNKCLLGLITPTSGDIIIKGSNISNKLINEHSFGVVLDNPGFYENLSGEDNLKLVGKLANISNDTIHSKLEMFNLASAGKKQVGKYSLGMKQRLALARAFLTEPEVVILDEPTNGLDPEGIIEIRNFIAKCADELGTTFIYCSHMLSEVENICNKIGILKSGQVVKEGSIDSLLYNGHDVYLIESRSIGALQALFAKNNISVEDSSSTGIRVSIPKENFQGFNVLLVNSGVEFHSTSELVFRSILSRRDTLMFTLEVKKTVFSIKYLFYIASMFGLVFIFAYITDGLPEILQFNIYLSVQWESFSVYVFPIFLALFISDSIYTEYEQGQTTYILLFSHSKKKYLFTKLLSTFYYIFNYTPDVLSIIFNNLLNLEITYNSNR